MTPGQDKPVEASGLEAPALRPVVRDGVSHAVMLGAGESYFGAFAIFLRASSLQVGLVSALPAFLGALFQFWGVRLMERRGVRRPLIVWGAIIQALTLLPIAALAFVPGLDDLAGVILILLVAKVNVE